MNAYLAGLMLLAGPGAADYGVAAVLRLRAEESGALAEPVLVGVSGRARWGLSHVVVAVAGMAALLASVTSTSRSQRPDAGGRGTHPDHHRPPVG